MASLTPASSPDMSIAIKVVLTGKDENRKFKLPLKELGASSFPDKLRSLLSIPSTQNVVFERYSDSSSSYITLDSSIPSVYKQLYRAAKAKQKLKIRATVTGKEIPENVQNHNCGPAHPEHLSTRCYVQQNGPELNLAEKRSALFLNEQYLRAVQGTNPSTATLVAPAGASSEALPEISPPAVPAASIKPYYWPMSHDSAFSESTKSAFEKKVPGTKDFGIKKSDEDEAPLPRFFTDREHFMAQHANINQKLESLRRAPEQCRSPATNFTICCNNCEEAIPDAHWHCGICDMGDFDLCGDCVEKGNLCDKDDHWLIKRFVKDGKVIPSTTETIGPKKAVKVEQEEKVPGAFTSELKREEIRGPLDLSRTCNSCVGVFDESNFVTCIVCEDYDLCIPCHVGLKHGHHPNHHFAPASQATKLTALAHRLCAPGRNMQHYAICDGCEKDIYGVRHKCMNCPDFDYCPLCIKDAHKTHPGHRLVPLYEPISMRPRNNHQRHIGIFCDGPLCGGKDSYIVGERFKCAVCHDTDFCANCEALPKLDHNRTHPLIKFKTPVRNVSVTTMGEKPNGEQMRTMGDLPAQTSSRSTETAPPAPSTNAATQVQTVAEVKPTETIKVEPESKVAESVSAPELQAEFLHDLIPDGSFMPPNQRIRQTWTLRNPGPHAWPAGCCVCYIGGDSMLDVDSNHPSHVTQMYKATKSNIIDRVVEVGEEVDFDVFMRTPDRKGKAISYWRLKDSTGLPFGHKLWCDIEVRSPEPTTPAVEQVKTEHIEDISKHAKVEDEVKQEEEDQHESKMIFPKLDKESPVSSTHEAQAAPVIATPIVTEKDLLEDVESLELDDESDSDEAFLTDEEYELIATEDEFETAKNGRK